MKICVLFIGDLLIEVKDFEVGLCQLDEKPRLFD